MNRLIRLFVAGSVALAAGVSAPGCVDNTETLFIAGVQLAQPPQCLYKSDPTQPFLLLGTLDVLLRHGYQAGLLVGNQFTARGAKQNLRAESTRITLRGAEVTLTDSTGAQLSCASNANCGSFTVYGTGFVDVSRSEDPGWGIFYAELIPQGVGQSIQANMGQKVKSTTVIASVKVFGESLGGEELTSSTLTFPIQVCQGCLINFPLDALTPDPTDPTAPAICVTSTSSTPGQIPCQVGQDDLVDCRLCAGQNTACQRSFVFKR